MGNSVVWERALSRYKIFGSQTPQAFLDKRSQIPNDDASKCSVVLIDILRATSTLLAVGGAGCLGIYVNVKPKNTTYYPFTRPDPFRDTGHWVFGGELNGQPITGRNDVGDDVSGVISNSPIEARSEILHGKYLRFFSTNGAAILESVIQASTSTIYAMAVANVEATVDALLQNPPERIWFTCGAFYGSATLEDSVAAGLAIERLLEAGFADEELLDDEASSMLIQSRFFKRPDGTLDSKKLIGKLQNSQVGSLLSSLGHQADIGASITGEGINRGVHEKMGRTVLHVDQKVGPFIIPVVGPESFG